MTERDRILASLSPSERAIYAALGGALPTLGCGAAAEWYTTPPVVPPARSPAPRPAPPLRPMVAAAMLTGPRGRFAGGAVAVECVENPALRFGSMQLVADFLRVTKRSVWKAVTYGGTCRGRHWRPVRRDADAA